MKGGSCSRSVELFDDYASAEKRFYAIIASDLADDDKVYIECFVRDNFGNPVPGLDKVFDRRDFNPPEPEPEPTPAPVVDNSQTEPEEPTPEQGE